MTIEVTRLPNAGDEAPSEAYVAIQAIGVLEPKDLEVLGSQLDLQVEQHGTIRLLIELVDFQGWTPAALWEDARLAFKHYGDIDRVAVVGESRWEKEITTLGKLFTKAEVRYFDVERREDASAWIRERSG